MRTSAARTTPYGSCSLNAVDTSRCGPTFRCFRGHGALVGLESVIDAHRAKGLPAPPRGRPLEMKNPSWHADGEPSANDVGAAPAPPSSGLVAHHVPWAFRSPSHRGAPHRGAPMAYDLVIRHGTLSTAPAPRRARATSRSRTAAIVAVGAHLGRRGARSTPRGCRDAGLRRHPHPLRRPGHLGPGAGAVLLARRHHGRDG